MYLYTGSLEFAVYEFEGECRSRSTETISSSEDSVPRPSPMSIYRLADKVFLSRCHDDFELTST